MIASYHGNETRKEHGHRVKVVARVGEVMEPDEACRICPEAEKGVLPQTDLPRVSTDQVPRLGNPDVDEGEEEKIDEDGLFGVDNKR